MSSKISGPALRVAKLLGFALVLHFFVLPQIGGARDALSTIGSVSPFKLSLVVLLEGIAFLVYARLTQMLLPQEYRPGIWTAFGSVLASTGVNHVVPGGAATTAAVNYRLLGHAGVPRSELRFALGTQAIGSAVVLNGLLWLALLVAIPARGFDPLFGTAAVVGVVLIGGFSLVIAAMLRGRDTFAYRVAHLLGRIPKVDEDRVRASLLNVANQIKTLAEDPKRLRMVIVLAAANWLFDAAALWVTLWAFGTRPSVVGVLVAHGLANLLAAVPISPGGLGVIEAVLIPTLVGFGTPASVASVGVVVYRLAQFWLPIPVGALAYAILERPALGSARSFFSELKKHMPEHHSVQPATIANPDE